MQTENPDEFYDVATRNKKFGRVDALNGPRILEKYDSRAHHELYLTFDRLTYTVQSSSRNERLANFSSRFGMK
jgi:exocyst complex component 6